MNNTFLQRFTTFQVIKIKKLFSIDKYFNFGGSEGESKQTSRGFY